MLKPTLSNCSSLPKPGIICTFEDSGVGINRSSGGRLAYLILRARILFKWSSGFITKESGGFWGGRISLAISKLIILFLYRDPSTFIRVNRGRSPGFPALAGVQLRHSCWFLQHSHLSSSSTSLGATRNDAPRFSRYQLALILSSLCLNDPVCTSRL